MSETPELAPAFEMVPPPADGRIYSGERRVRLGDVSRSGRLRLDATARYLQDVSNDDTRDAALPEAWAWLVRRTTIHVRRFPVLDEVLRLDTFCSGTGPRWAERRVRISGSGRGLIDAATVWVHMDPATGRPLVLPGAFHDIFTPTAHGRRVSARILHPSAPVVGPGRCAAATDGEPDGASAVSRPWPQRAVDLDVLGHANNAVAWASVEELLAERSHPDAPVIAEVGFHRPVEPGDQVSLVHVEHADGIDLWLTSESGLHTSALVRPSATEPGSRG